MTQRKRRQVTLVFRQVRQRVSSNKYQTALALGPNVEFGRSEWDCMGRRHDLVLDQVHLRRYHGDVC